MKEPITVWLYVNEVVKNGDGYDVRLLPAKTEPTYPLPEVHVRMASVDGLSERWVLNLQPSLTEGT